MKRLVRVRLRTSSIGFDHERMDIPIGMKNPTSGDLSVMLNSVVAAQGPHRFIYRGQDVTTGGNDLAYVTPVGRRDG